MERYTQVPRQSRRRPKIRRLRYRVQGEARTYVVYRRLRTTSEDTRDQAILVEHGNTPQQASRFAIAAALSFEYFDRLEPGS